MQIKLDLVCKLRCLFGYTHSKSAAAQNFTGLCGGKVVGCDPIGNKGEKMCLCE